MKQQKHSSRGRLAALFLVMVMVLASLAGCSKARDDVPQITKDVSDAMGDTPEAAADASGEGVEPLGEENELPADGVVSAAQMETIAGKEGEYHFNGTFEDGAPYRWTYDGKKIQNPIEQKLKVELSEEGLDEIKEAAGNAPCGAAVTLDAMEPAAPAELTVTLPEKWDADRVLYCTYENGKIYKLSDAEIEQVKAADAGLSGKKGKVSRITFTVTKAAGTYYLVGGSTKSAMEGLQAGTKEGAERQWRSSSADRSGAETAEKNGTQTAKAAGGQSSGNSGSSGSGNDNSGNSGSGDISSSGNDSSGGVDGSSDGGSGTQQERHTCTISIECSTLLGILDEVKESKREFVPADGWILYPSEVEYTPGETVFDVLKRVCNEAGIHMASRYTPMYGSYYIEGINQLYEFDGGSRSGWMYCVNGWFPNYGCSSYTVEDGDNIEWQYTCELGSDVGNGWLGGS